MTDELTRLAAERATVSAAMSRYAADTDERAGANRDPEQRAEFDGHVRRLAAVDAAVVLARRATLTPGDTP